ncbi:CotH kinase family protein [Crocinitomicaceae bacterium]|nr:CotH kinase family protein [Crocinitomicaceae bacterium]MDC0257461.1 CotH kinase family protein [Crocinitomicaceae bacterium]
MFKWFAVFLFLFSLISCGSQNKEPRKEEPIAQDGTIRIYSDSIGWSGKLPCQIHYNGKKYKAAVKYRGGISSMYPKHSMTVEFEDQVKLGDLPMNDDYIFNANYIDKTFQRHKLSYDIFRLMDAKNKAPRCDYLPIYLNDNYLGLYVIMEKVNGSWLGFDNANPKGARLFKDPFVFIEERLPNVQEPNNYYQQKFPKQSIADFNDEPEEFKKAIFNTDDETFELTCFTNIQVDNLLDWHLLLLLTNNDDGLFKNFYLYKEERGGQFKFIPWDYDHSFGRDGNYEFNLIDRPVDCLKVPLLKRLIEMPSTKYAERLTQRYLELRKTLFTEKALLELIDKNEKEVRPFVDANRNKWPMDGMGYLDANDFDQEMAIIKQYIPMRLKQLDAYFYNLEYGEEEKD